MKQEFPLTVFIISWLVVCFWNQNKTFNLLLFVSFEPSTHVSKMCFVIEIEECCWVSLLLSLEWKTKYQNSTQVPKKDFWTRLPWWSKLTPEKLIKHRNDCDKNLLMTSGVVIEWMSKFEAKYLTSNVLLSSLN